MGILNNKRILVTGVLTDSSIAFGIADQAQKEGAKVILSGFGRGLSITQRAAKKLDPVPPVIALDVMNQQDLDDLPGKISEHLDGLDSVVHSIGFAPSACIDGQMFDASWPDVATAIEVSTYSFAALAKATLGLLESGDSPSVIGLDFDATVAWPGYNWMGVAKAGLESLCRYLARDLGPKGIRVNLISAGPIRTIAAKSVGSFSSFQDSWGEKAPLGWDPKSNLAVARSTIALLSDFFPSTTGEVIHVDGGFHAVGA